MGSIPLHSNLMANLKYGTVEYYSEMFSDVLADANADKPEVGTNLVLGFLGALKGCRDYHAKQVDEYDRIEQRVRQALTV